MAADNPDPMQQVWYCLTCCQTFRYGKIRYQDGGLHCPKCGGGNMDRAADMSRRAVAGAKAEIAARKARLQ